jgi:hypothetical protein
VNSVLKPDLLARDNARGLVPIKERDLGPFKRETDDFVPIKERETDGLVPIKEREADSFVPIKEREPLAPFKERSQPFKRDFGPFKREPLAPFKEREASQPFARDFNPIKKRGGGVSLLTVDEKKRGDVSLLTVGDD